MAENTKFELSTKHRDEAEVIYLKGFLDAHTAPQLEAALDEQIKNGNYRIIVNFADLEYISSAGLGVFMAFIETVRDKGGDIKLCSMKKSVYSVFDLLGFPLLFDISDDEETALKNFEKTENKENQ
jgi:anti-sigma B factor antagonist